MSTLLSNIFYNPTHTTKSIFGNLTSTVSDHLPQFVFLPEFLIKAPQSRYDIYTYDLKEINEEKFILEFNIQDWGNILVLDRENVNETIDHYLQNLNNLLERHAALRKYFRCQKKILK